MNPEPLDVRYRTLAESAKRLGYDHGHSNRPYAPPRSDHPRPVVAGIITRLTLKCYEQGYLEGKEIPY
jgi:hypothetical protein